MMLTKVYDNGHEQIVNLPKEYRFTDDEMCLNKVGNVVVLFPKKFKWAGLAAAVQMDSSGFMFEGRPDQLSQCREEL